MSALLVIVHQRAKKILRVAHADVVTEPAEQKDEKFGPFLIV
jgi:hypothetical protein